MGIRPDRDPGPFSGDDPQAFDVEVLPVGIRIDLERRPGRDRAARHLLPVTGQARAEVVDPPARMGEDLHVRILQAAKVPLGLVVAET
jgi:hypothetical protein